MLSRPPTAYKFNSCWTVAPLWGAYKVLPYQRRRPPKLRRCSIPSASAPVWQKFSRRTLRRTQTEQIPQGHRRNGGSGHKPIRPSMRRPGPPTPPQGAPFFLSSPEGFLFSQKRKPFGKTRPCGVSRKRPLPGFRSARLSQPANVKKKLDISRRKHNEM